MGWSSKAVASLYTFLLFDCIGLLIRTATKAIRQKRAAQVEVSREITHNGSTVYEHAYACYVCCRRLYSISILTIELRTLELVVQKTSHFVSLVKRLEVLVADNHLLVPQNSLSSNW